MIAMEKGQNLDVALKELEDAENLVDIVMPGSDEALAEEKAKVAEEAPAEEPKEEAPAEEEAKEEAPAEEPKEKKPANKDKKPSKKKQDKTEGRLIMQEFIETVVKQLVDKPAEVNAEAVESEQTVIYELTVGDGDYGKVIGKRGRNISAIRTILFAINAKEGGKRARLDVIDTNVD